MNTNNLNGTLTTDGTTSDTLNVNPIQTSPVPCPSCGHCPTCGRGGYYTQPYPYYPFWCGSGGVYQDPNIVYITWNQSQSDPKLEK